MLTRMATTYASSIRHLHRKDQQDDEVGGKKSCELHWKMAADVWWFSSPDEYRFEDFVRCMNSDCFSSVTMEQTSIGATLMPECSVLVFATRRERGEKRPAQRRL
jgi:hypothetical protein